MSNIYITPNEYRITLKKSMIEGNIYQDFRLKNIDEIRS